MPYGSDTGLKQVRCPFIHITLEKTIMPNLYDGIQLVDPVVVAAKAAKISQVLTFNINSPQTPAINTVYKTGPQNIRMEGVFPIDKMMLPVQNVENVKIILVTADNNSSKTEIPLTDYAFELTEKKIWIALPVDVGANKVDGYIELRQGHSDRPIVTFDLAVETTPV